jgi:hypothetical protein
MSNEILFSNYLQCLGNYQYGCTEQLPEKFDKIKKACNMKNKLLNILTDKTTVC